jgi:glucokinase
VTAPTALGIDLGGTRLRAGLVDKAGRVARRRERSSRLDQGETPRSAMAELLGDLVTDPAVTSVGIAASGPLDRATAVIDNPFT